MADEPTREMLAKARKQTHAYLTRKLKVNKGTVRRIEKRSDLYISTLRSCVEGIGGELILTVRFPDQPPVFLAGLGKNETRKKAKKNVGENAKSKGKMRRAA